MTAYRATKRTESKWAERVQAWRASGQTAQEFATRHGFAASTLHGWSSRLPSMEAPRFLRLVPKSADSAPSASPELVVEVGAARVRVGAGFDRALLADVVRALVGGSR